MTTGGTAHPASTASGSGEEGAANAVLFRAVGLNEAADIRSFGGFRPNPSGRSMEDKWFATSLADAVAFGRLMQRELPNPRPFVIVEIVVTTSFLSSCFHLPRLDRVGPAYLVRKEQLAELNGMGRITIHEHIYAADEEQSGETLDSR